MRKREPTRQRDEGLPNFPQGNPNLSERNPSRVEQIPNPAERNPNSNPSIFLRRIEPYQKVTPTRTAFFFFGRFRPQRRNANVGAPDCLSLLLS
jgi:hypothetical protein